jgi:arylsulfatase A-like enzyme
LWNFNSREQTAGGSHGGINPEVSRVLFLVWGGKSTGVARGQVISDVHTTLDVAPTLMKALGMLSDDQRVIRANGAFVERPFHPFPGRIIDLWQYRQEKYATRFDNRLERR